MVKIELSIQEIINGCTLGLMRTMQSKQRNSKSYFKENKIGDQLLNAQTGAMAELAYCKMRKVYFVPTIGTYKEPDVLLDSIGGIEVRSSNRDDMKVRPDDKDVYVVSMKLLDIGKYEYMGWMWCGEAKQRKWMRDIGNRNRPAYFVPNDCLNTMELPKLEVNNENLHPM